MTFSMEWAYALGAPSASATFRAEPADFCVDEMLGFEPCGSGEHVFLHVEKRGDNTTWVAAQIARLAGVHKNDVGYAGLKDRHAITRQWFSVYLPKAEEPDWSQVTTDSVTVLKVARHNRKLRRGEHLGNRFVIRLRDVCGDRLEIESRLASVSTLGVPNYYGPQRFGIDGNNLVLAQELLVDGKRIKNQQQRGMMLSAGRSYLFNLVLSARVGDGSWGQLLSGDPGLHGMATGPLWGRGRPLVNGDLLTYEQQVLSDWQPWCNGLEHVGLSQERRLLALRPDLFQFEWSENDLILSFALPAGAFATAVLREICELKTVPDEQDMI